jgi:two-component system, sensor histidine kinase and response regulator
MPTFPSSRAWFRRRRRPRDDTTESAPAPVAPHSAEHLLRVIEGARLGLWSWHFERQAFEWSPLCLELFGVPPSTHATYERWLDHVHVDDRDRVRREVRRAIQNRGEFLCDYRVVWPDGSIHWLTSFGQPIFADDGTVSRLEGFAREITQRKQAEALAWERSRELQGLHEALSQRAVEAETALRAKDAFLRNVSHELRTPLNHIVGGVDVLRQESHSPEQARWLDIVGESAKRLLAMIEQLLNAAATEAEVVSVDKRAFSPRAVLREAIASVSHRARARQVAFEMHLDWALPDPLVGDPTLVAQALLNYVDNAAKFAPPGSSVHVSATVDSDQEDIVQMCIEVHDDGPGVPEEVRRDLFSEFAYDDSGLHRLHGGLGIGLANTRKLVALMGGEVGFSSEPGRGSCFWFTVPLERAGLQGDFFH